MSNSRSRSSRSSSSESAKNVLLLLFFLCEIVYVCVFEYDIICS